ncbi:hypothetical protein FD755_001295 [Muntiacus reevesi]|uniref:MHC class I-like antigen recognition-like domain-containing protein n=1 Tax=Muntiacus reevesi TaxID=9886 RepID=A0A5J5N433_MUNRE|nr:hypothetical protein FD755_001295 [Muntiacus reevesi]
MLLPLLLLVLIIPGGDNEGVFQEPTTFYLNQILTYAQSTWLEDLFRVYFIGFTQEVQDHISEFSLEYSFVIQVIESCGLHSGETTGSSLRGTLGGLDFVRLQNHSRVPAPDSGSRRQKFCALMTQYPGISSIIEKLMSEILKFEASLSSGPPPRPGFYPKPVWVTWVRDEQEEPGTQQGDIMPNADWTWYLDILFVFSQLPGCPTSIGLILVAIILPSLILLICLTLWFREQLFACFLNRSCQNIS